jgi:hypothetical protein
MKQVYLAHPLGAKTHEGILKNLNTAKLWYKWACDHYWPNHCFNMMWALNVEVYDDANAVDRERGMQRNYAHIKRCDELWLLGPRISEGMEDEARFAHRCRIPVYNLTSESLDPTKTPRFPPEDMVLWHPGSLTQRAMKS